MWKSSPAGGPSSESMALKDKNADPFEMLASSRRLVPLDDKHRAIIEALTRSGFTAVWVPDYHLLQTHTKALASLLEDPTLEIKGIFRTISPGKHPETANCFCFPLDKGAWRVYRFSPGVPEAETWNQDPGGWTNCYFNKPTSLSLASKLSGGQEAPDNKGFAFSGTGKAKEALELLGQPTTFPDGLQEREVWLKPQKDGRVAVTIKKEKGDATPEGWLSGRGCFQRLLDAKIEIRTQTEDQGLEYDGLVRTIITPNDKAAGWLIKTETGSWSSARRTTPRVSYPRRALPRSRSTAPSALVAYGPGNSSPCRSSRSIPATGSGTGTPLSIASRRSKASTRTGTCC